MAMVTFKKPKPEPGKASGKLASPTVGEEHTPPPTMYLEHHHLEQLGLKQLPQVGSKIKMNVVAHVGSASEDQDSPAKAGEGKVRRSMRLHIHSMDMGDGEQSTGEPDENQREEKSRAGAKAEMDKALERSTGSESSKAKRAGAGKKPGNA